ncbi:hypothetical protein ACC705_35395, partial [Rhizobium ruizarguesonis]
LSRTHLESVRYSLSWHSNSAALFLPGKPLTLVGGRAFFFGHPRIVVDVATMGDPQNVISEVFWNEILEHTIVPMSILLV